MRDPNERVSVKPRPVHIEYRPGPGENRGYAPPVFFSASDGLHRIQVARPLGDPFGITTAEHFRTGPVGSPYPATRAMSRRIWTFEAIRVRVIPLAFSSGVCRLPP